MTFTSTHLIECTEDADQLRGSGSPHTSCKAAISTELDDILTRIGSTADQWRQRMQRLSGGRLLGRFACGNRETLRELAGRLGVSRLANLSAAAG